MSTPVSYTHLVGTVHMIKHGLAHLEANKSGNMILVSSIAGRDGMGMLQTYSASKAAVTSLMQSAAKHAAPYGAVSYTHLDVYKRQVLCSI